MVSSPICTLLLLIRSTDTHYWNNTKKYKKITKTYENRIQHPNLAHAPGLSGAYMAGQNRRIFSERGGVLLPPSEIA